MVLKKIKNLLVILFCIISASSCAQKQKQDCNIKQRQEKIEYSSFASPKHFATHYSQVFKAIYAGSSLNCSRRNNYSLTISDSSFKHNQPAFFTRVFSMDEKVVVLNEGVTFDSELEKLKSNYNNNVQSISDWQLGLIPPKITIFYYDRSIKERKHNLYIKDDNYEIMVKLGDDGDTILDINIDYLGKKNDKNN